jgi:hypothetical protein
MKLETFDDIVSDAGYELESYSGRGMYGAQCASIRMNVDEAPYQIMARITEAVLDHRHEEIDIERDWLKLMAQTRTDSLGLGIVLYWTNMAWDHSED